MQRQTVYSDTPHYSLHSGVLAVPISDIIMQALRDSRKILSFYTHQAAAIDAIREGKNVIVSTSTASGKSVIYQVHLTTPLLNGRKNGCIISQVPMLRFLEEDRSSKAIYIYPTKVSEFGVP